MHVEGVDKNVTEKEVCKQDFGRRTESQLTFMLPSNPTTSSSHTYHPGICRPAEVHHTIWPYITSLRYTSAEEP